MICFLIFVKTSISTKRLQGPAELQRLVAGKVEEDDWLVEARHGAGKSHYYSYV